MKDFIISVPDNLSEEELTEAVKKVVRDGKVVTKKIPTHKKKMSAAQKRALAIARKKAHNGKAELKRAKSMKKARKLGEEVNEEEKLTFKCMACGYSSNKEEEWFPDDTLSIRCPSCGAYLDADSLFNSDFDESEEDE